MTTQPINEETVEQATITWLNELGYTHRHGPDIADDNAALVCASRKDVITPCPSSHSHYPLESQYPFESLDEALHKVAHLGSY